MREGSQDNTRKWPQSLAWEAHETCAQLDCLCACALRGAVGHGICGGEAFGWPCGAAHFSQHPLSHCRRLVCGHCPVSAGGLARPDPRLSCGRCRRAIAWRLSGAGLLGGGAWHACGCFSADRGAAALDDGVSRGRHRGRKNHWRAIGLDWRLDFGCWPRGMAEAYA